MELEKAIELLNEFRKKLKKERPLNSMPSYDGEYKRVEKLDKGYIFYFQHEEYGSSPKNPEVIIVRDDEKVFEIYGAMAKLFLGSLKKSSDESGNIFLVKPEIGNPLTGERWIGSGPGRYQLFEKGIMKWEGAMNEDIAHMVTHGFDDYNVIGVTGFVAFADIRGFTKWVASKGKNDADRRTVHDLISNLEEVLQKHFAKPEFHELFVKGVGDGFMIVQYEFNISNGNRESSINTFIRACLCCCEDMGKILKNVQLGVGFGVDIGQLTNVLILGRWDYIGEAVNNASKLQAKANNAVVISDECYQKIKDQSLKTGFKNPNAYYVYQN